VVRQWISKLAMLIFSSPFAKEYAEGVYDNPETDLVKFRNCMLVY
jgi:hypothetical protein